MKKLITSTVLFLRKTLQPEKKTEKTATRVAEHVDVSTWFLSVQSSMTLLLISGFHKSHVSQYVFL